MEYVILVTCVATFVGTGVLPRMIRFKVTYLRTSLWGTYLVFTLFNGIASWDHLHGARWLITSLALGALPIAQAYLSERLTRGVAYRPWGKGNGD
jgi:hypothetical protein